MDKELSWLDEAEKKEQGARLERERVSAAYDSMISAIYAYALTQMDVPHAKIAVANAVETLSGKNG